MLVSIPDRGPYDADGGLRLAETLRLGTGDQAPNMFADVFSLAVDGRGAIYVADGGGAKEVIAFDGAGNFARRFGRQGDGPGEFRYRQVGILAAWQSPDRLWVVDGGSLALIDTAGSPLGAAFRRLGATLPEAPGADAAGYAYVRKIEFDLAALFGGRPQDGLREHRVTYRIDRFRLSPAGDVVLDGSLDLGEWTWTVRVANRDGLSEMEPLPFQPDLVWTVAPNGAVWVADRSEYRLHELTFAGDTVRTLELRRAPAPLDGPERDSVATRFGFDPGDLPALRSAMDRVDAGPDGLLWVRNMLADGSHAWDVFDACGRYLGNVQPGMRLDDDPVVAGPDGTLLGVVKDEMDIEHVVRLALRTPDGSPVAPPPC